MDRVLALALGLVDALDAELDHDLADQAATAPRPSVPAAEGAPATVTGPT